MAYTKPDVTVLQEFRNLHPSILKATLQSCIVGPATWILRDQVIGAYSKSALDVSLLNWLPSRDVTQLPDSFKVTISDYAGDHEVTRAVVREQSNNGVYKQATHKLTDDNGDFEKVQAGDLVHILAGRGNPSREPGYYSGFYPVMSVTDEDLDGIKDTIVIDASIGDDLEEIEYIIQTAGFIVTDKNLLKLPPDIEHSGLVKFSGAYLRKDYSGKNIRLISANSISDLEDVFGAGNIVPENPLAFGMYKTLATLGANDVVTGVMVESDNVLGYAKALEFLESQEVYCLVPLTNDPNVHQLFQAHVDTMSREEEKKERICVINTGRFDKVIKAGYFGRKDVDNQGFLRASGTTSKHGTGSQDQSRFTNLSIALDGTGIPVVKLLPDSPDRLVLRCRAASGFVVKYRTKDDTTMVISDQVVVPMGQTNVQVGFTQDGIADLEAPTGSHFHEVSVSSTEFSFDRCEIFAIEHTDVPATCSLGYAFLANPGTQMWDAYFSELLGGGSDYKFLKIRHFNRTASATADADNYASGILPSGMVIDVTYSDTTGGEHHKFVNFAGSYPIPSGFHITGLRVFNALNATNIDDHVVELMLFTTDYDLALTKFRDEYGTFISSRVRTGDKLIVYEGPNAIIDPETGEIKRYTVADVLSEKELLIGGESFNTGASGNYYRIEAGSEPTKDELAQWYAGISKGYTDRRVTHLFAPVVGVSGDDGQLVPVEGYYVACAWAGMTQSDAPQNGFTNKPIPGFIQSFYTNDFFSDRQLDIIAGGGTAIIIQNSPLAPLTCRHQLTTDMTTVHTQEYSVTKNLDHMAKTARITFRPYIGRFLINNITLTTLYSVGNALVAQWMSNGQINGGEVDRFLQDKTRKDRVLACFYLDLPIPLNHIRLIFVI